MSDTEYDTSDTEYDEDDENTHTVYASGRFKKFAGKEHRLSNLTYFQTFGGGPEGGFVWDKKDNIVYSLYRNWGIPFIIRDVYYDTTIEIVDGYTISIVPVDTD
jgi:hypothetical protein